MANKITRRGNQYSPFIPNEIRWTSDYAEIVLYDRFGTEIATTKISKDKVDLVKDIRWVLDRVHNYVIGSKNVGRLHRYLLQLKDKTLDVDHINGDTLDNRDCNLRICSRQQNMYNRKTPKNNTTGHKGIDIVPNGKYRARIKVEKKEISKRFETLEQAIAWRKEMEQKHHKEFIRLKESI